MIFCVSKNSGTKEVMKEKVVHNYFSRKHETIFFKVIRQK